MQSSSVPLRSAVAMTAATLMVGIAITSGIVVWLKNDLDKEAQARFDRSVERIETDVRRRFNNPMSGLKGARGAYAASNDITRLEFRAYVESQDMPKEFSGVRGFGFIVRVRRADLDAFIAAERADFAPEFEVRTAGDAADLFVIKYIEPIEFNRAAVGFDIGQEAVRREAAERAMNTGQPALSGKIGFVQDGQQSPGFLYILPIYRNGVEPVTPVQHQKSLVGLLFAPIMASELFAGLAEVADQTLHIEVFDGSVLTPASRLFDSKDIGTKTAPEVPEGFEDLPELSVLRPLAVGGRTVSVRINGTPALYADQDRSSLALAGVAGTLVSLFSALAVWLLAAGRLRAQKLANKLSADAKRLAMVVEHTNNAVTLADTNMRINWVNPAFTQMTGYTLEEARGRTPAELLGSGKSDPAVIRALDDAVLQGVTCRVEVLNRTKEGHEYWVETEVQPSRDADGRLVGFMEIGTDITARKLAEEQAQRSATILRNSIEALDDAFVLYDDHDRLVMFNQRYKDFYPESAEVLEPGNTFEEIIRYGVERGQYQNAIGREEQWVQERLALHRQEHSRMQQTTASGRALRVVERRTSDGYTVGFRVDVSDLVRATQAAEEASRSKSQFLANMSHEIRTPMNAILGMLKLLQNTELTGTQLDYALKAEGAARSLLGLLNDILDFSKVEAGKMTLDPRPFRLDRVMRDLSVILSANVGQRPIEVLFDIDPEVPRHLVGDDMRLIQVLINLGGNAIKFTETGEVVLRVRLVRRSGAQAFIEFAIQDSGIGIAPENQARIFSGFSQAEANTTRRFGGTGLGLAISKRLIELMQGELKLTSVPGVGSTFSFVIPLEIEVAELAAAPHTELPAPEQAIAIRTLVVDDNAVAREIMKHMIQSLGWQADVASSGVQALNMVKKAMEGNVPYRAIFMDWQMPHMDGWRTSERIREFCSAESEEQPAAPSPLIVMITAHSRDMLTQRNAREHALLNGFLVKPVTASMLLDAVQDAMSAEAAALTGTSPSGLHTPVKLRRLEGLRLLVVEDNKINQVVAQGLLSQEGAEVIIAEDGQRGVDAVANAVEPFDVVLMDLQMPVMDGYDATRAIRQQLGNVSLPIIAMTANAMASDKAACLAAGMNDHVGKPFDLDELVRILLHHVKGPPIQTPTSPMVVTTQPAKAVATDAAEPEVLDVNAALGRMGNDTAIYSQVIQQFVKDLRPTLAKAESLLRTLNLEQGQRTLHTLKGLAATVGAMQLSAAAAQLESLCKTEWDPVRGDVLTAELLSAATRAEAVLENATAQYGKSIASTYTSPGAGLPSAQFADDLHKLEELLIQSDMTALELFAEFSQDHGASLGSAIDPLAEALASLDFALAAQLCREMK